MRVRIYVPIVAPNKGAEGMHNDYGPVDTKTIVAFVDYWLEFKDVD